MMRKRSFTLIELLAVMAIIAVLAGLILGIVSVAKRTASRARNQSLIEQIELAVQQYYSDYGYYPGINDYGTDHEVSIAEWGRDGFDDPQGKPYLDMFKQDDLTDSNGNPFWFRAPGRSNRSGDSSFDVWSMGRDGEHGIKDGNTSDDETDAGEDGSDDICNWKRN